MGNVYQDVKPGNLLFTADGTLKLTDFGLAVSLSTPDEFLFHQVVTLRWRAPELLMGCRSHGRGVDLWSVGCIFAELLQAKPLFDEASELGMLVRIVKVLGAPTIAAWPVRVVQGGTAESVCTLEIRRACVRCGTSQGLARIPSRLQFGESAAVPWSELMPSAPPDALDLLSRCGG